MKRLICLMLAVLLVALMIPSAVAEEDVVLRLEGATGNVGDTVTVAVKVENAPECVSFEFRVSYDANVLKFESGQMGEDLIFGGTSGGDVWDSIYGGQTVVQSDGYTLGGTREDPDVFYSGDATLFSMTFKIISETPEDFGSLLEFQQIHLGKANAQDAETVTPDLIVEDRVFVGDDLGRTLSTAHAVRIMQHLIDLEVDVDTEILDQTGDEDLTIADAVAVLRALNGT